MVKESYSEDSAKDGAKRTYFCVGAWVVEICSKYKFFKMSDTIKIWHKTIFYLEICDWKIV